MSTKKVVSVQGKLTVSATGGFNYNSSNDIHTLHDLGMAKHHRAADNYKMHKREFRYDDKGGVSGFVYVIDSACIRHHIFASSMPQSYPEMSRFPHMLYNAISSPEYIARGYMFTTDSKNSFFASPYLKFKSPFTISKMTAVMEPIREPNIVVNTRSGYKKTVSDAPSTDADSGKDAKDTSLRFTEIVPALKYTGCFAISMRDLEFVSCDDSSNNRAIGFSSTEYRDMYFNALKRNFESEGFGSEFVPSGIKPYYVVGDKAGEFACEEGYVLSNPMKIIVVRRILKSMFDSLSAQTRPSVGTILDLDRMDVTICYNDGTEEVFENVSREWAENLDFESESYYEEADEKMLADRAAALIELQGAKKRTKSPKKKKEGEAEAEASNLTETESEEVVNNGQNE